MWASTILAALAVQSLSLVGSVGAKATAARAVLLRGASQTEGRVEQPALAPGWTGDYYRDTRSGFIYSYNNPNADDTQGYVIEPTWGGNWKWVAPGNANREWSNEKWAWVPKEGGEPPPPPAPAPGPAEPPPPPEGNALTASINCKTFKTTINQDYPDQGFFECHNLNMYGTHNVAYTPPAGCYCYAWSTNCPEETCTSSNAWEGEYCIGDKAKKDFGVKALTKWTIDLKGGIFKGNKHHDPDVSLCAYWIDTPSQPDFKPVPAIDGAKWKRVQSVLVFQGLTLAGCYDATKIANYEKTKKDLETKLNVKADVLYMICAEGGAEPEWKFLQLKETTRRSHGHGQVTLLDGRKYFSDNRTWHPKAPDLSLLQQPLDNYGELVARTGQEKPRPPCAIAIAAGERNKAGCPTDPPIMFPYTPTATLTVEVHGLAGEVEKATQESEQPEFCFKISSSELQPEICATWESGKPCCPVAPVTPEPAAAAA